VEHQGLALLGWKLLDRPAEGAELLAGDQRGERIRRL
jgi:hypothetical protein